MIVEGVITGYLEAMESKQARPQNIQVQCDKCKSPAVHRSVVGNFCSGHQRLFMASTQTAKPAPDSALIRAAQQLLAHIERPWSHTREELTRKRAEVESLTERLAEAQQDVADLEAETAHDEADAAALRAFLTQHGAMPVGPA
jgi:hypothetical protein